MRLTAGMRLEKTRERDVPLVLTRPDGKVQLNRTAGAILLLCDGSRDREEIIAEVVRRSFGQTRATEIVEFLDAARARGWISEE